VVPKPLSERSKEDIRRAGTLLSDGAALLLGGETPGEILMLMGCEPAGLKGTREGIQPNAGDVKGA
jgi:hypothetical protein